MRFGSLAFALALLSACGPSWAPPNAPTRPCETIDAAAFNAAREAGAAVGRAVIHDSGMVSLDNGPGVSHCATYTRKSRAWVTARSAMRPCRRPNDYVIEYTKADGDIFYVRVPANTEYRFNVGAAPNTCQIVLPPQFDN